jgi:hypothetical protein
VLRFVQINTKQQTKVSQSSFLKPTFYILFITVRPPVDTFFRLLLVYYYVNIKKPTKNNQLLLMKAINDMAEALIKMKTVSITNITCLIISSKILIN